jgi:hypothetical protein
MPDSRGQHRNDSFSIRTLLQCAKCMHECIDYVCHGTETGPSTQRCPLPLLCSLPFRDGGGSESNPMLGMRVSPSGAYLLLLLKGAPAELWTTLPQAAPAAASAPPSQPSSRTPSRLGLAATQEAGAAGAAAGGGAAGVDLVKPWRVRLVDLPFSAVEWVAAEAELQKVGNSGHPTRI